MVKRLFIAFIFLIVPLGTLGFTLGSVYKAAAEAKGAIQQVFSRQEEGKKGVLLVDKAGSAIVLCLQEEGNTYLVSILPSATPGEYEKDTFYSVYRNKGIDALEAEIEKCLSCKVEGYLRVDFSRIAAVVDALDGVEMGGKHLKGQELQSYLKSIPDDYTGMQMQQEVILAVGRRFCTAGFWKGQNAFRKLMQITDTDLSLGGLISLGKNLIPALEGRGLFQEYLPGNESREGNEEAGIYAERFPAL